MNEEMTLRKQRRSRALQNYLEALKQGDDARVAALLEEARTDPGLERMLLEVNSAWAEEEGVHVTPAELEEARARLQQVGAAATRWAFKGPSVRPVQVPLARRASRPPLWRRPWMVAAVLAVLALLFVFSGGTGLAAQFLTLFSVQHFQPVSVNPRTVQTSQLPRPSDLGDYQFQPGTLQMQRNLSRAQAAQFVTFPLKLPAALPSGFAGRQPVFDGLDGGSAIFTFRASKAHAYLVRSGHGSIAIPAVLDGATFAVHISRGMELHYLSSGGRLLAIVEMPSPTIEATGKASLEDLRAFLLSLPGLPAPLVEQLKRIDLQSGTIPLPILPGMSAQPVSVQGQSAVLLTTGQGASSLNLPVGQAVLWEAGGIIYLVGESGQDTTQLVATANSLR
jgi:hypothetical protein